ncbi:glutamyl-tRNA(Gln) amidotransferase subunit B [Coleophoma cylindrospora]|uniref:Glutamyl-tRNA(Gln) amidotransferase subunit B, mitochondrial n=1 Tax=Coleophoma cylindrospora TaxID=1849047 RepID=A0A3D8SET1_9HELO|nr:glutamyl-tRNA(Gln) amidotransferase subunit B [Coleophoma cylindrospora]
MARIPPMVLRRYICGGHIPTKGCLRMKTTRATATALNPVAPQGTRLLHTDADTAIPEGTVAFRKQLKDEAKRKKAEGLGSKKAKIDNQVLEKWELTVGIEIHAQLNTPRKLFSSAASTINEKPNTHVALFDLAMPGSQPKFQKETLIPAVRAALALNCEISTSSRFDRKHYFHWDQPAGYQITQYYQPFARNGYITLYAHDGIAKEDGDEIRIGIKQVQMEQDTAKTITQPGGIHLLDFNRVGLPLIEIITLPQIHHPSTAAAFVRKVQILLDAVDACVLGMESGGLRADVNVSVRRRDGTVSDAGHSYAGVEGLGQRTEIKNLSSFKAVEDAIIAERDRQIEVLEAGGKIAGETRGWTIGSSGTRRLRGKEGEVDYRYMPDPELGPVLISPTLIEHLQNTLGALPDAEITILTEEYGLTIKDAMSLVSLDNGGRAEFFRMAVDRIAGDSASAKQPLGRLCGNWVLHELGGLTLESGETASDLNFDASGNSLMPLDDFVSLIKFLEAGRITGKTSKRVLRTLFENSLSGASTDVEKMIEENDLWFRPMSTEEYQNLARSILDPKVVEQILKGQKGKIMFLVGQMMKMGENGQVDPQKAREVLEHIIEENRT